MLNFPNENDVEINYMLRKFKFIQTKMHIDYNKKARFETKQHMTGDFDQFQAGKKKSAKDKIKADAKDSKIKSGERTKSKYAQDDDKDSANEKTPANDKTPAEKKIQSS